LSGNSEGIRAVYSSRLSHREQRSSLSESHSFLSLPADTTMASSQGTQSIQQMTIAWYIPTQTLLLTCRHHDGIISRHSIHSADDHRM